MRWGEKSGFALTAEVVFLSFVQKHRVVLSRRPLQCSWKDNAEGRVAEGGAGSDLPSSNDVLSYSFLADQANTFGRFAGGSAPGGSAPIPAARTSKDGQEWR